MKIYFYLLPMNESYYAEYGIKGLRKLGHDVVVKDVKNVSDKEEIKLLKDGGFDLIIYYGFSFINHIKHQSIDYFLPTLVDIPYIVHFFDNPLRYLYQLETIGNTNFTFFVCDSELASKMRVYGYTNTHYAPCMFDEDIQFPRRKTPNFSCDVSFAGSVMTWGHLMGMRDGLNLSERGMLNNLLLERNKGRYFDYISALEKHPWIRINGPEVTTLSLNNILEQKHLLRMEMFEALKEFDLHVYGQGDWDGDKEKFPNLIRHNRNLNQHTELPYLYSSTKINTTIELLPTSVHQRIMEVTGCGGFILCEDKLDMKECFSNYVVWHNLDDMRDKTEHYLKHDTERNKIAANMHKEAKERHTSKIRMKEILKTWKDNQ